ncbi:MAG: hypothetical protein PVI86_04055 [Phycisphaerae bacterium]|jgi:hypothetical protein
MSVDAAKALQYETEFLSGVDANFEAAKGKQFRGSTWQRARHDEGDHLRALLAKNRVFDRERLKSLPANRRVALHGFERRMLLWKRRTGVAVASVLSPMSHYASSPESQDAPPIGLGELADHVRGLVGDAKVPHIIGVCATTGFTEEARNAKLDLPNATVILIEPDSQGGWRTTSAGDTVEAHVLKIFDPESTNEKIARVRRVVEEHSADLLTAGLSSTALMNKTGLEKEVVRSGLEQVAAADPELKLTEKEGDFLLFRGAMVQRQERKPMNVVERIRQLFSREGDEAEKMNLLAERRAALAQRRDRIYEDISKLERKEADLLAQGKAATSHVPRRRLAAQLNQLRKDIARQNTTAAMLNRQIDIISTDIHNLTLIQQGEMAQLPDTTELTENAVKAEEMLETLQADAELVGQLETGMEATLSSDEELAILKEFEGETADEPAEPAVERTPPTAEPPRRIEQKVEPSRTAEPTPEEPPTPPPAKDRPADAEAS